MAPERIARRRATNPPPFGVEPSLDVAIFPEAASGPIPIEAKSVGYRTVDWPLLLS
jgi:hypothetical protein